MRLSIIFVVVMLACQTQNNKMGKTNHTPEKAKAVTQSTDPVASHAISNTLQENEQCHMDVCLQLRNHDASNKSFEIYMINTVPVFGFQCDLPGINITGADGGLLKENDYQTPFNAGKLLSYSMEAKSLPIGGGVLTKIYYSDPAKEVCMTGIIFAGIGGSKLKNDVPECMMLN